MGTSKVMGKSLMGVNSRGQEGREQPPGTDTASRKTDCPGIRLFPARPPPAQRRLYSFTLNFKNSVDAPEGRASVQSTRFVEQTVTSAEAANPAGDQVMAPVWAS